LTGQSDSIAAFILITPSKSAVFYDPCLADVHVIRSRDVTDATYAGLISVAVKMTRQLDLGYTDCVMSVATSCCVLIEMLSRAGFTIVATLPRSINMSGIGLTDTVLMIRNLGLNERPVCEITLTVQLSSFIVSSFELLNNNCQKIPSGELSNLA